MSVVGCDFGSVNTVIAVARNRGVDVITNEVSNRATPSLVAFGPKSRYIGEPAKNQEISNLKNTVGCLTRLAGRSFKDPDVAIEQQYISAPLVDVNGQLGVEVTYLGNKEKFTAIQLMAMFFTKVKQTAAAELKVPVADMVISCPAWYTDAQRRNIIDAAEIAGLKVLRLINDTTAVALGYGIPKTDLPQPEEKPRRVAFIDIGNANYTCSIVEFKKGELAVKSTACDRHFGGRDFDKALLDHFQKEFKEKFKIDIFENPKARFRVLGACEKLKKVLSANASAPLNIESLMNDVDVRSFLKREELEELVAPLLEKATEPIKQALADAKLKPEDIDQIEMVGGCTRVPALKNAIQDFFGRPLSFTLNQDEAAARGCAFSCALASPLFRVRDFAVHDIMNYPIEFTWEKSPDIPDEDTSLTVFNRGNTLPSTKILTFYRKQAFDLEARYAKPEMLPGKINPWIGRFSVKGVKPDAKDDFMICKLKARMNPHGILNVEQGYYVEEQEIEEPIPEPKEGDVRDIPLTNDVTTAYGGDGDPKLRSTGSPSSPPNKRIRLSGSDNKPPVHNPLGSASVKDQIEPMLTGVQAMETDDKEEKPKTRKVKKQVKKGELPLAAGTASLDTANKEAAAEREYSMAAEDKLVADTEDKKNELESFIYELRSKIDEVYAPFANDDEKSKIREKCEQSEDWLYDEGEDATKAIYVAKIEEIRSVAGPIIQRYRDSIEEQRAAITAKEEAKAAKKMAEIAAKKEAEQKAKEAAEASKAPKDEDMKDAEQSEPVVETTD